MLISIESHASYGYRKSYFLLQATCFVTCSVQLMYRMASLGQGVSGRLPFLGSLLQCAAESQDIVLKQGSRRV